MRSLAHTNTPLSLLCVALYCHTESERGSKGWMRLRYLMLALSLSHIFALTLGNRSVSAPPPTEISLSECQHTSQPEPERGTLVCARAADKAQLRCISALHNNITTSCILCLSPAGFVGVHLRAGGLISWLRWVLMFN